MGRERDELGRSCGVRLGQATILNRMKLSEFLAIFTEVKVSNEHNGGALKQRVVLVAGAFILTAAVAAVQTGRAEAAAAKWSAMSTTAMSITGDVTLSPTDLTMAGTGYPLTHVATVPAQQRAGIGQFIAVTEPAAVDLYRIKIPGARKLRNGNTLCGGNDVAWLLVVSGSGPTLALAFFSGAAQPPLDPNALSNSTALCGTFTYGH
jgi:hypothetical protein